MMMFRVMMWFGLGSCLSLLWGIRFILFSGLNLLIVLVLRCGFFLLYFSYFVVFYCKLFGSMLNNV